MQYEVFMKNDINRYDEMMNSCPMLYADRHLPMTATCMCWGIEAGDGWFEPLNKLSHKLERLNEFYKKDRVCIRAEQVKEKFGTLRFYYRVEYVPSNICRLISSMVKIVPNTINKHVKFKYVNVIDKPAYETDECDEISKESYDKLSSSKDNNKLFTLKEEDGKFYKMYKLHHAAKTHRTLCNHEFAHWVMTTLNNVANYIIAYEPSAKQEMIREALEAEAYDLVRTAENECYDRCEICGSIFGNYNKRQRTYGWIKYICKHCAKKHNIEVHKETEHNEKKD